MLKRWVSFFLAIMLTACAATARSSAKEEEEVKLQVQPGDFLVSNFQFESGQNLQLLTQHYVTLGTPQRDSNGNCTNAVLLLHGITGAGQAFLTPTMRRELFAPGQPLDATRYYIIIPDALGRGGSSKPSDGLRAQFPKYSDKDIVDAQYRLVTEGLRLTHLNLVLGVSTGGRQTWIWGERYPAMMDRLMVIGSQPVALRGRDAWWRKMVADAIRRDPSWRNGDYASQPTQWLNALPILPLMLSSASALQDEANTQANINQLFKKIANDAYKRFDANDELYWLEASNATDPEPELAKIEAKLYAVNFQDDLLNTVGPEEMSRLVAKVPQGDFVEVPHSIAPYGHRTVAHPETWKSYLIQFLQPSTALPAAVPLISNEPQDTETPSDESTPPLPAAVEKGNS